MHAALGHSAVLLGFLASLGGAIAVAVGLVKHRPALIRSGRGYVALVVVAAVAATAVMEHALLTDTFSLKFVAENSARATPLVFKVATMWSALEGSIILWALVLAGFVGVMTWHFRRRADDPMVGWAMVASLVVCAFFFLLMVGPADPFTAVAGDIPRDGPGPNPLLQNHILMAVHPPMLYLGYVGFTIPFAFAVAALVTGRVGEGWLIETRRWTLFAWGCLTGGIILGAWWSYEVLGWGGFWAWDPVENASFLPWLTATAYLHSVMVQERRGMLRVWNLSLVVATFSLTILGTFLTRSGVLESVHSFTESPIGPMLLAFFALVVVVSVGLIGWRGDQLRSGGAIESPLSREGFFLANNLAFAVFAFVVLLGTVFPLIAEAVNGDRLSVGRPYFDRMTRPVGLVLLFLMAVAPLLPWRRTTGELLRQRLQVPAWIATAVVVVCVATGTRGLGTLLAYGLGAFAFAAAVRQLTLLVRRNGIAALRGASGGGMIVHIGVVVLAVAFAAASTGGDRTDVRLEPGESARVHGHTIRYIGIDRVEEANKTSVVADVAIDGSVYQPALTQFPFASQAIGTPSVKTSVREDVYLILVSAPRDDDGAAVIGVIVQPLVVWLWIAGGIMLAGTALSAMSGRRRATAPPTVDPVVPTPLEQGNHEVTAPVGAGEARP